MLFRGNVLNTQNLPNHLMVKLPKKTAHPSLTNAPVVKMCYGIPKLGLEMS